MILSKMKAAVLVLPFVTLGIQAHTFVHSVWVNGVDQGTGLGVRQPVYIGAPNVDEPAFDTNRGSGFRTAPVRDLDSIDMRCNVLGDIPHPHTIQVKPGDIVTFEWHHKHRGNDDQVIDSSHKGAGLVYISPNPPQDKSWVKIQQEGLLSSGQWYVTGKHTERKGKQDVVVPPGLKKGYYILRPELLALHESEVSHLADTNRGIQIYISCIQIEVVGNGTVSLPQGASFPGTYKYTDPGIVYNLYSPPAGGYPIPGPAVWSGAAPSPNPPAYGTQKGVPTQTRWYTWLGTSFSTATQRTSLTISSNGAYTTTAYTPFWPTTYAAPTGSAGSTATSVITPRPTVTAAPTPAPTTTSVGGGGSVPKYGQCGGLNWSGGTQCAGGLACTIVNEWYSQCS